MKLSYQHKRYYVLIMISRLKYQDQFFGCKFVENESNNFSFSLLFLTFTSYGLPDVPFFAICNPPLLVSAPFSTRDC